MATGARERDRNGVLWVIVGGRRLALVVEHGKVTEAWPPYLGRWAVGKSFRWLFDRTANPTVWVPDATRIRVSARHDTRRLRRWEHPARHTSQSTELSLGWIGGHGDWYVAQTGQLDVGWAYRSVVDAVAEVEARLASGDWQRVVACFDRWGQPQPEVDVPELVDLDAVWPLTGR